MFTELCQTNLLAEINNRKDNFTEKEISSIVRQILEAI